MISKKLTNSGSFRKRVDKHSIYTGNAHDSIPCYCWAKTTRHPGGQQQPWSSQSHVRRADQHGTRKMAIPAMANRIICVKIASASLAGADNLLISSERRAEIANLLRERLSLRGICRAV